MKKIFIVLLFATQTLLAQVYHADQAGTSMHSPFRWIWADSAARVAQTTTKRDTTKLGYQVDDFSVWYLVDSLPTWNRVGTYKSDSLEVGKITADSIYTDALRSLRIYSPLADIDSISGVVKIGDSLIVGINSSGVPSARKALVFPPGGAASPAQYTQPSNGDKIVLYNSTTEFYSGVIGIGIGRDMWFKSGGGGGSSGWGSFEFYPDSACAAPYVTIDTLGLTATALIGPLTGNVTGDLTGNAATATQATNATNVNGGSVSATTGTFSGAVSSSAFSGPLTGNVTGNVTGSSGSCTGNSATATQATNATNVNGGTVSATTAAFSGTLDLADYMNITGIASDAVGASGAPYIQMSSPTTTDFTIIQQTTDGLSFFEWEGAAWYERMNIAQNGDVTMSDDLSVSNTISFGSGASGATATPYYINTGQTYSNGKTKDKIKIWLYNSGAVYYGFGIGEEGDIQYHSDVTHDFYINNDSTFRVRQSGTLTYGSAQFISSGTSAGITITGDNGNIDRIQANGTNGQLYIEATDEITLQTSDRIHLDADTVVIGSGLRFGDGLGAGSYLDEYETGTFACTLSTSMVTVQQTGTIKYERIGNQVTLVFPAISGTSNSSDMTLFCGGAPSSINPTVEHWASIALVSSDYIPGTVSIQNPVTSFNFRALSSGAYDTYGFTETNSKGIPMATTVTYLVN